jgi:hypothetical protein
MWSSVSTCQASTPGRASCSGGPGCCTPPFSINETPDVDEHEAEKIRRKVRQHHAKAAARQEEEGA